MNTCTSINLCEYELERVHKAQRYFSLQSLLSLHTFPHGRKVCRAQGHVPPDFQNLFLTIGAHPDLYFYYQCQCAPQFFSVPSQFSQSPSAYAIPLREQLEPIEYLYSCIDSYLYDMGSKSNEILKNISRCKCNTNFLT